MTTPFRDYKCFAIEDEKLLPKEYLMPDEIKIRKCVNAGIESIPGVRIWTEKRAINRGI